MDDKPNANSGSWIDLADPKPDPGQLKEQTGNCWIARDLGISENTVADIVQRQLKEFIAKVADPKLT
ncbi:MULTISPECIES: hypothetical protein [unclassified Neorhizobium]|uniref:hypothetical protein n=1 Tax=unclassified Neorhizobium TaxID=2629175 RepID=UPI001FF0E358|nr:MULTISPECIES: hypothetical protein [unclassified Neorhizobium]MCJ9669034.1 hypothetical protein [Neorhizobium sp. SHOUNA12B]MCJ9744988.1 hypothetical protein [Neorhizobium sp. SHOUNA12A]